MVTKESRASKGLSSLADVYNDLSRRSRDRTSDSLGKGGSKISTR
jgi:hypothetical protein